MADQGNNRVQEWAPGATSGVTVAGGNGQGSAANQLYLPVGVAVDSSGNVYVADTWNHRVQEWAPGATSGVTVAGGNGYGSAANQLDYPTGVALDSAGDVYVVDRVNARVQEWAPGATSGVTVAGGSGGSAANQFLNPYGVALDSFGNIYVADESNDRIQRWGNLGSTPTVLPGVGSVLEGNSGTTDLQVPVTLSNPSTKTATVQWTTLYVSGAPAGQADPATDYTPASGTVTFAPGETSKTVTIQVNGDTLVEPDEYIVVSFHDPTNATVGGFWGLGFGVITNDDHATVLPGIGTVAAPTAAPPTWLSRSPSPTPRPCPSLCTGPRFTCPAHPTPATAPRPRTDYTPSSGTVTFAPGDTTAEDHIPVTADTLTPGEYVVVSFHDPTNATMGGYWGLGFGIITPAP